MAHEEVENGVDVGDVKPGDPFLGKEARVEIRGAGEEVEDVDPAAESAEEVVPADEGEERVDVFVGRGEGVGVGKGLVWTQFRGHSLGLMEMVTDCLELCVPWGESRGFGRRFLEYFLVVAVL